MGFIITLKFSDECKPEIKLICEKARRRWMKVITDGFEPATIGNHRYETLEIQVSMKDIPAASVIAEATYWFSHPETHRPLNGYIRFDRFHSRVPFNNLAFMEDVAFHEMGHVVGIHSDCWRALGITGFDRSGNKVLIGQKCRREFGQFIGAAPKDLPLEKSDGYLHIQESTFGMEIMSPYISSHGNYLGRTTLAILEDLGYTVNYGEAEDPPLEKVELTEFDYKCSGHVSKDDWGPLSS